MNMGNSFWLLLLLVAIQLNSSSQQLTFARSWVRGEFANDEDGGGNQDYDSNIRQPQNKRAKSFYMRSPVSWNSVSQSLPKDSNLQSEGTLVAPEENASNTRFQNWNCQYPHFYRYIIRSREGSPFRHPHV